MHDGKIISVNSIATRFTRRDVLGFGIATVGAMTVGGLLPGVAQAKADTVQTIADHFSAIRSMTGEFVQFDPRGQQTGGKFYIERPGKIRFNYDSPKGFSVVADGKSVVVDNKKMNTYDVFPLSKTPLKMLLADRIDLSGNKVKSIKQDDDLTTIQLIDKASFGGALLTLMFDPKSYELRQWTVTDAQGKETTVMVFNVKQGVALDDSMFKIDYVKSEKLKTPGSNR